MPARITGWILGALAFGAAAGALAQAQVYRYIDADGKVVYSDRAPTGNVKDVQTKRMGANFVQTSEPGFAAQQASERFPVTLYSFECGDVCQNAEGLLNRRGVPFTLVNVQDSAGQSRLQALTNDTQAPVLAVGDKLIAKGYNEARWQAMLDEAGYPKTPAQRRNSPSAKVGDVPPPAPVASDTTRTASPPVRGGDYPK
jgi:glutaredoxin